MQKINLEPFFKVNDISEDLIFINCTLGNDGNVNLLFAEKEYDDKKIFKKKDLRGYDKNAAYFKIQPEKPQNYLLVIPEKNKVIRYIDQKIDFYNEKKENLSCVHAQKDTLFFWNSKKLYKVSIKELE